MTVLELAIFFVVYRAMQPIGIDDLADTLAGWFDCPIAPDIIATAVGDMVGQGWLVMIAGALLPAEAGRRAARTLIGGIVEMLDHGTRLLDVALMMAVLRLTKEELDHGDGHH